MGSKKRQTQFPGKTPIAGTKSLPHSSSLERSIAKVPGQQRSTPHRYTWLFLFICFIYLCTLTDTVFDWISDGQVMFDTAVSLHEFGELGISPEVVDKNTGVGATSDYFGKYGLGLSVIEQIPLLLVPAVEKLFGGGRSNVLFALMNMLITALTALGVAVCLCELGVRFWTAALASIGFAFGTPAWPYTSYDFSEPLQALCLIAAFWSILRATKSHPPSRLHLALTGFILGFAVLTKALLLILIPSYALYLWMRLEGSPQRKRRSFGWFVLSLALWGATIALLNFHRFGSVFEFGYGGERKRFTTPLLTGLYGLLLSPTKGLVFYAPLALLLPWALWKMRTSHRREFLLILSIFVLTVMLNSKWWSWEGGISWGPRLLLPVVPLLVVGVGVSLESARWMRPTFVGFLFAGAIINLLGVLMNFLVWTNAVSANHMRLPLEARGRPAYQYVEHDGKRWFRPSNAMWYIPALSPVRGHAWLLRLRYFDRPFPLQRLEANSPGRLPRVEFPPVEIDFALLTNAFSLSQLRSAHFWLWGILTRQPREEIFSYPVYGVSIERQGDRAVARGDGERALECYERAAELMPNYAGPALKLSRLQMGRRASFEAKETLTRFLSHGHLNPDQERAARLQLAQLYESIGSREAAINEYRLYLGLHPSEENRGEIERHLTELLSIHP